MKNMRGFMYNHQRRIMLFFLVASTVFILACSPKSIGIQSDAALPGENLENVIQGLDISEEEESTRLTIQGSTPMNYTVFKSVDDPRIVVDIHNSDLGESVRTITVNNGTINKIKSTQFDDKAGRISRIEIGLDKIVEYEVVKDADKLIIYIGKSLDAGMASEKRLDGKPVEEVGRVEDIDFKHLNDKSRVRVSTSRKTRYDLSRVSEDTLVLELAETEIPGELLKHHNIDEKNSAVKLIKPHQTTVAGVKAVTIGIKLRTMVPYYVFQDNNTIYVDFDQSLKVSSNETSLGGAENNTPDPPVLPTISGTKVRKSIRVNKRSAMVKRVGFATQMASEEGRLRKRYTGKRISMDFKDADIKNLFRLIAEVSNLNLITGDDVKGNVTIRMVKVPWDQALDVILVTKKLGMVKEGNIVRIAPAETLRKEEALLLERKKKKVELEDLITDIIPVNYAMAKDILRQVQSKLSPRGKVTADDRTNFILITDIAEVVKEAKGIVSALDTPTPQVLIEARIVQTNPTFTSELGIQWGGTYENTAGAGDYTLSGVAGSNYAINLPSSAIHGGLGYGFIIDKLITLDLKLSAMEKDEKVKIVSRPRIITLDNKKAMIEQGVDLPYLKQTEDGISTQFKKATLSLEVTPHITPDGSIIMKMMAKKDQKSAQTGAGGEPGIDTRKAETEVLVKDGETTVIGGIYERTQTDGVSGVPFLSKIPILGWLFKSTYKKDEVTELLIFITPTIIKQKAVI